MEAKGMQAGSEKRCSPVVCGNGCRCGRAWKMLAVDSEGGDHALLGVVLRILPT